MIKNVKIGADPELFLIKEKEVISAEGLIGGTKNEPKIISDEGHAVQEDNVMVEFNIPPSENEEDFLNNINFVKDYLKQNGRIHKSILHIVPHAKLKPEYLKTDQAKSFGCEPDFNVYNMEENESCSAKDIGNIRVAGGHIHIGYENPNGFINNLLIKMLDITLGLESVILDTDEVRRKFYGFAGSFRIKEYGVEYRTLSNFWIKNDELIKWAYKNTMLAINLINSGKAISLISKYSKKVELAINDNDKSLALSILENLEKETIKEKIQITK